MTTNRTTADQLARVFAAFDARDISALTTFITDDVQLRLGNAPAVRGEADFVNEVNAFHDSVAGVRHELLHVYTDDDIAIVEFDVHYTRRDGKTVVRLPCCNVFRITNGLISEYRSYVDATPVYAPT